MAWEHGNLLIFSKWIVKPITLSNNFHYGSILVVAKFVSTPNSGGFISYITLAPDCPSWHLRSKTLGNPKSATVSKKWRLAFSHGSKVATTHHFFGGAYTLMPSVAICLRILKLWRVCSSFFKEGRGMQPSSNTTQFLPTAWRMSTSWNGKPNWASKFDLSKYPIPQPQKVCTDGDALLWRSVDFRTFLAKASK